MSAVQPAMSLDWILEKRERDLTARNRDSRGALTWLSLAGTRFRQYLLEHGVIAEGEDPLLKDVLTVDNVTGFLVWLKAYHALNPLNGAERTIGPSTIRRYCAELKTISRFAVAQGWLPADPLVTLKLPKATGKTIVTFTDAELHRMRAAIQRLPDAARARAIFHLLLDSGMRASEICGLKTNDLDLAGKRAKVLGKGAKERWVQFDDEARNALIEHLRHVGQGEGRYVFFAHSGHPLSRDTLYHLIASWGKHADVADAHPHRFRHTFATRFLAEGGDIRHLQLLLGHSSIQMSLRYAQWVDANRRPNVPSTSAAVFGAPRPTLPPKRRGRPPGRLYVVDDPSENPEVAAIQHEMLALQARLDALTAVRRTS